MKLRTLNTAREYFTEGSALVLSACSELHENILKCFRIRPYTIQGMEHEGWGVIYDLDLFQLKIVMCEELNIDQSDVTEEGLQKWVLANLPSDITVELPEPDPDQINNIGIEEIDYLQIPDKYIPREWYE